jgi:hypothetical protein
MILSHQKNNSMPNNINFALLLKQNAKVTVVLGSGFHRHFLGQDSILSSWELLLQKLSPITKLTGEYHLDFEKIIESKKTPCEDSSKTEERLLECVNKMLQTEQERVLENCASCYPIDIFNPKYVSDVISLNFDEIPELLLKKREGVKLGKLNNNSSLKESSKDSYSFLTSRFKTADFGKDGKINFWHPHGVIGNKKSIILGLHKYSHMLETSIRLRNSHMKLKRKNEFDLTWYQALLNNPVIILGADMSSTEWDLWFALTSRNRANGDKQPIFQMRECECKTDAQHEWFEPLFTGMDFNQQWKELEKLFKV